MADGIEFRFNLPDFNRQLKALSQDMEQKVIRAATAAAARTFYKRALQFVPILKTPRKDRSPGILKRALYVFRSRDRSGGREHYVVGVRGRAKSRGTVDAFYWRWVEQGHLARGKGTGLRGGKRSKNLQRQRLAISGAKRVQAHPYLKPAFETGKDEALKVFYSTIEKRLAKANQKR
jgi:HK97 gp10 family phage protein